jgi:hypothetical protein
MGCASWGPSPLEDRHPVLVVIARVPPKLWSVLGSAIPIQTHVTGSADAPAGTFPLPAAPA